VYNNSFHNASRGVYINGGRLTSVRENYFENCDLAINFADPGTGHHKGVDQPTMGWDCACFRPCLLVCLLACCLACLLASSRPFLHCLSSGAASFSFVLL
jgi:hypothetical protein